MAKGHFLTYGPYEVMFSQSGHPSSTTLILIRIGGALEPIPADFG